MKPENVADVKDELHDKAGMAADCNVDNLCK